MGINILSPIYNLEGEKKAIVFMIIGGLGFATMGALTFSLGKVLDWTFIAFFRMLFSLIVLYLFAKKSKSITFIFSRKLLWLRSIVGSVAMLATFYSFTKLPVSDVSAVTEIRPIWVAVLAAYLLRERIGKGLVPLMILSTIGVLLIEKPHFEERNYAVFITFLASVLGAVVMICLRKLRDLDAKTIVIHFSLTAALVSLLYILIFRDLDSYRNILDLHNLGMLTGIGISGTIGQLFMTKAFAYGRASIVSSTGYVKVGFSAMYDLFIFNSIFELYSIIGMIMILISTTLLFNSSIAFGSTKMQR